MGERRRQQPQDQRTGPRRLRFDYYLLNSYVPELDGDASELFAKWFEQLALAEELGFSRAWITEHHFHPYGGMLPNPQLLIAALARRTRTLRFGTSVSLLALHHPLRIAEDMAILDVLTDGRLDVGVGRGMAQTPYRLFGADPETAQEQTEEFAQILRAAWTQERFCWSGKYFQCPTPVAVMPRPIQRPHPPIWMPVSHTPPGARWIGRQGFNLMTIPWMLDFASGRRLMEEYDAGLAEGGHPRESCQRMAMYYAYVGETPEAAEREVDAAWGRHCQIAASNRGAPDKEPRTYEAVVANAKVVFGDPDMCRRQVRRLADELGMEHLALVFHFGGLSQELTLASMTRFARDVAPAFAAR